MHLNEFGLLLHEKKRIEMSLYIIRDHSKTNINLFLNCHSQKIITKRYFFKRAQPQLSLFGKHAVTK
jgi:hypothetical protein